MAFALRSIENLDVTMEEPKLKSKSFFLEKDMKIFIDIKSFRGKLEQLDLNLKKLNISREEFLTKDVNYIVCHKFYNSMDLTISAPQGKLRLPVLSRGHTLLQRSNSVSTVNNLTDPFKFAETWKIPIITPDELNRFIKAALLLREKKRNIHKNRNLIRYFKRDFIKIEDVQKKLAPVFKCFDQFPTMLFLKKYSAKSLRQDKLHFDDQLKCDESKEILKKEVVKVTKKEKPITKNAKNDKMNYCECCEKLFEEDVPEHILTIQHKQFAHFSDNFISLDNAITKLPTLYDIFINSDKLEDQSRCFKEKNNLLKNTSLKSIKPNLQANKISCDKSENISILEFNNHRPNYLFNIFSPTIVLKELYNSNNSQKNLINEIKEENLFHSDDEFGNNESRFVISSKISNDIYVNSNNQSVKDELINSCSKYANHSSCLLKDIFTNNSLIELNIKNVQKNISPVSAENILPPQLELIFQDDKVFLENANRINLNPPLLFRYDHQLVGTKGANGASNPSENIEQINTTKEDNLFKDLNADSLALVSKILNVSHLLVDDEEILPCQNDTIIDCFGSNEVTSPYEYCKLPSTYSHTLLNSISPKIDSMHDKCHLVNKNSKSTINNLHHNLLELETANDIESAVKDSNSCVKNLMLNDLPLEAILSHDCAQVHHLKNNTTKIDTKTTDGYFSSSSSSHLDIGALIDIPDDRLRKMNETIQALWTSTYITDLKIKLSKITK